MPVDFEKECFFIAPIGEENSPIRKRSDGVRDLVVKEAAEVHGLTTRRADDVDEPGQITSQIVEHCLKAKMCVADLTGGNPNVYYELSVRHGKQLPVVLIAETGTNLPFDVGHARVIFFEHGDLTSAREAREAVKAQIGSALENAAPAENPIANGMRLATLEEGTNEDRAVALLMERLERLTVVTNELGSSIHQQQRMLLEVMGKLARETAAGRHGGESDLLAAASELGLIKTSKANRRAIDQAIRELLRKSYETTDEGGAGQEDEGPPGE